MSSFSSRCLGTVFAILSGLALSVPVQAQQVPTVSINSVSVAENGGNAVFTVTISRDPRRNQNLTVRVTAQNAGTGPTFATAGSDFTAATATLTFTRGGSRTQTFSVPIANDATCEGNETFNAVLSQVTNGTIGTGTGVGTINSNDPTTVSIASITVGEAQSPAQPAVTLAAACQAPVSVNWATANAGTGPTFATAGQDYTASSGTVTFAPGNTTTAVSIPIIDDTITEQAERFNVNLSNPVNATIGTGTGVVTITDNDVQGNLPPVCQITQPNDNPITVARGGTVDYLGAVTDPNGDPITSYSWTFGGGTPGTSNLLDPTPVTYSNPGTFTTTFTATAGGQTCTPVTKTVNVVPGNLPNTSINSTSQSCGEAGQPPCSASNFVVPQQPAPGAAGSGNTTFRVFANNDLGMHCGDLDTRVASILPPFNVLHAVVIQQAATPVRNPAGVTVNYSAGSNPNDPALALAPLLSPRGGVYKTNFWDIARLAYDPFYPASPSNPFLPPFNLTMDPDLGLPVPDVEALYIDGAGLTFDQQAMPGILNPYVANDRQNFLLPVATQPFFVNFPFGYRSTVNWLSAEGVPISAFDDYGRENAYPLMRVQARNSAGTIIATTDTVMPISAEADCQACHAAPIDGGNGTGTQALVNAGITLLTQIDDPSTTVPIPVNIEWASDRNILNLHDLKHGTTLASQQPVVCQKCHYTPALDLAQVGPNDVNGRQQTNNQTMSRVMHNHHGTLPGDLFPPMPAPVQDANGVITNQAQRLANLSQTCYRCHPGDKTACLRGAMFNGGMLCQDCHGNMTDVGNDFSRNQPGGGFVVAGDYYTNANTPRIPWANEPGCGSCHTGDFNSSLANTAGTITNLRDVNNRVDNLRLLQAFRSTDANKKPIVPTNKRFAEDVITPGATTAPGVNPKLYRVSVGGQPTLSGTIQIENGHNGIFCEACHGSTHAEWPNRTLTANDNVQSIQLQGHTGTITDCDACHGTAMNNVNTLGGPHGMHPVGSGIAWSNGGHRNFVTGNVCVACHGPGATDAGKEGNQGTVLSRAAEARNLRGTAVAAGQPVGCSVCH